VQKEEVNAMTNKSEVLYIMQCILQNFVDHI
jgi:hypothetical protein